MFLATMDWAGTMDQLTTACTPGVAFDLGQHVGR